MRKILILSIAVLSLVFVTKAMAAEQLTVASDTTTSWSSDNITYQPTFATYIHPSWPTISGATWIWRTAQTDAPQEYADVPEEGWYFKKTFEVPPCAEGLTGTIDINSDNAEALYFNGTFIGRDGALDKNGPDTYAWQTIKTYAITPVVGQNTILVKALNYFNYGPYDVNPAGLSFKATINYTGGDNDNDGVCDLDDDMCLNTVADSPSVSLGVNRHVWTEGEYFTTLVPAGKKGAKEEVPSSFSILDTHGCSCTQILSQITGETGAEMKGHYKFGCSKGIMKKWISYINAD